MVLVFPRTHSSENETSLILGQHPERFPRFLSKATLVSTHERLKN
jgi:hypothetical protein